MRILLLFLEATVNFAPPSVKLARSVTSGGVAEVWAPVPASRSTPRYRAMSHHRAELENRAAFRGGSLSDAVLPINMSSKIIPKLPPLAGIKCRYYPRWTRRRWAVRCNTGDKCRPLCRHRRRI